MVECEHYRVTGNYAYCTDTKECDVCKCGGDLSKCDFYPKNREKAKAEEKNITANAKVETHAEICKTLNDIYERKNADYGDSFAKSYAEYGLTMSCIRLEDKLNRLKSLRMREAAVKDESIEDTLLDLANYAIMTVIEMRK